jgi:hypothetical protein
VSDLPTQPEFMRLLDACERAAARYDRNSTESNEKALDAARYELRDAWSGALDAIPAPSPALAAAPVSEEEGSEGSAAVSDCAKTMPGNPVAWCHRPEGHGGRCEFVFSTTVSPYRAPAPPPSTGDDLLSFIRREREKWRSGPKAAFGLLSAPEMVELFDHLEHLASAPPSTGGAPGPSEECHVEGCGWRWPRGSGLGCPQHPSPRAQTAPADDRFDCLYGCGIGVKADEDGCCATCGRDCVIVRGGVPTYPPMDEPDEPRAQTGTPDEGEPSDEILSNLLIRVRYAEEGKQDGILVSLDGVRLLVAAIRRLRSAALRREEREPAIDVCQRWTAQIDHLKTGVLALADEWESRVHGRSGAGKRSTYRICAADLRVAWDRLALEDAGNALRALSSPATNPEPETKEIDQ